MLKWKLAKCCQITKCLYTAKWDDFRKQNENLSSPLVELYTQGSNEANHAWSKNHQIDFDNESIIEKPVITTLRPLHPSTMRKLLPLIILTPASQPVSHSFKQTLIFTHPTSYFTFFCIHYFSTFNYSLFLRTQTFFYRSKTTGWLSKAYRFVNLLTRERFIVTCLGCSVAKHCTYTNAHFPCLKSRKA